MLIQSCPIRNLVLSGAHIFDDEGMKAISSAQFLESLELMDCINVTNAGMRLLAHCPCLINLTLRQCDRFSDAGVTEVARALKLETLVIEGCSRVSPEAVQGAATSVHYTKDYPGLFNLGRA
jgi:F-box/leucine-rich repeat protein 2/20